MHPRILLFSGILLVVLVVSFTHGQSAPPSGQSSAPPVHSSVPPVQSSTGHSTAGPTTVASTTKSSTKKSKSTTQATQTTIPESSESDETTIKSTKSPKKTTKKKKNNYGSYGSSYGSKNKYKGYGKGDDDDSYEVVGEYGNDPSKDGTDLGDFGPIKDNKKSMLSSLDVWISSANDWDKDKKDKGGYNGDEDSYKGSRGKRSYKKIRFPVKRVQNYRKFPIKRFPPLISIFPWVPIFYDKLTYQTIIFSPSGGLYIIPPLINFYGQRFAVAQLIKWGYASLVSSGAPVGPGVDVAPLVQPPPPGGAVAGGGVVPGGSAASGVTYDSNKGRFTGGIKTDFRDFKPRYSQTIEEGGDNYGSSGRSNYGFDSNYGGTRNQQIYPQGGPQNAGRFNQ